MTSFQSKLVSLVLLFSPDTNIYVPSNFMNLLSNTPLVNRVRHLPFYTRSRCRFLVGDISRITSPPSKKHDGRDKQPFFFIHFTEIDAWQACNSRLIHIHIKKYHFLLSCQSDLTQIKSPRATSRILLCLLSSLFVFVVPIPSLSRSISYFGTQCLFLLLTGFPHILSTEPLWKAKYKNTPPRVHCQHFTCVQFCAR